MILPLEESKAAILERLAKGDRLIAYTAGGVSWSSAVNSGKTYEFPEGKAITELFVEGKLERKDTEIQFFGVTVPVIELIVTKEKGKPRC